MIVSLHLPKTAGSSFRGALQAHYGAGLALDYADKPLGVSAKQAQRGALSAGRMLTPSKFAGVNCVHGHFLACKYLPLADECEIQWVTWLREPLQRLYSHYCYWQEPADPASMTALRRQMLAEAWSFREFALHPQMRNLYSRFLWRVPLARFMFVGISEHYNEDIEYFARVFLNSSLPVFHSNQGSGQVPGGDNCPADLRDELEQVHGDDMQLYKQALILRERQRPAPGAF